MTDTQGFGRSSYGYMPWGGALDDGPVIDPLSPSRDEIGASASGQLILQVRDRTGVEATTFYLQVDDTVYVNGGIAQNGASVSYVANAYFGFDTTVTLPTNFVNGDKPVVYAQATNLYDEVGTQTYLFEVGFKLRILSVENPSEGILLAHFSEALRFNDEFYRTDNWKITPVSEGAVPLTITGVFGNSVKPQTAVLQYTGGGSTYQLEVFNVEGLLGTPFESQGNIILFEILFGTQPDYGTVYYNSIFGAVSISQRDITRRTMDDHTADRALALAMDERIRLRRQVLTNTESRDGRPGKLRTA